MEEIDVILDEFNGQLSYSDILHMTYRELSYLRKHREQMNAKKGPELSRLFEIKKGR